MKKMKRLLWLLLVLLAVFATGCLKDDPNQGTIVLMGTESDVRPIDSIEGLDTLRAFVTNPNVMGSYVLTLPRGNKPPDIQGEYVLTPVELYKYNSNHPVPNDTLFVCFEGGANGQHNMIVPCDIKGDVVEKGNEYRVKHVDKAFVMGHDNDFTVYFTVDYECEELNMGLEFNLKRGYIITGTMTPQGIDHAVMACVNIEVSENVQTMRNRIYVYRVEVSTANPSGMAITHHWYHQ